MLRTHGTNGAYTTAMNRQKFKAIFVFFILDDTFMYMIHCSFNSVAHTLEEIQENTANNKLWGLLFKSAMFNGVISVLHCFIKIIDTLAFCRNWHLISKSESQFTKHYHKCHQQQHQLLLRLLVSQNAHAVEIASDKRWWRVHYFRFRDLWIWEILLNFTKTITDLLPTSVGRLADFLQFSTRVSCRASNSAFPPRKI